ncbi:MAG: hypothetical protein JZU53_04685 [Paludibacter sp.]|nr:hypothetical protein [Paludibacter sp.]
MVTEMIKGELVEVPEKEVARRRASIQKSVNNYAAELGIDKAPKKSVEQMLAEINAKLGK